MARHATGTRALAVCDRCGHRLKYLDLVTEAETRLRVCAACEDEPMRRRARRPDAVRLRDPRPDPDITSMD